MIDAVTFDLWDTVIHDNSDETKRRARGLPGKPDARRDLVWEALGGEHELTRECFDQAYDLSESAFNHVWHVQHVTWTVRERIEVLSDGLKSRLDAERLASTVRRIEEMEIEVMPDPVPGIGAAIAELAGRYRLAVVSDAIYSPGRCLRQWLEAHDLLRHFSGFAFSDEVGRSKPHRAMFAAAAQQLGVPMEAMVHVGDRDHNDVQGPHALGMKAVLFTVTRDRDRDHTAADAICDRAADLPAIIDRLNIQE